MCCVDDNIYLVGGGDYCRTAAEYNPRTDTWRYLPDLQQGRDGHRVCSLDNKIFVLGGGLSVGKDTTCEMLDLRGADPRWRYIASMNTVDRVNGAVVVGRKIYVLGNRPAVVEVYDVDQGIMMIE